MRFDRKQAFTGIVNGHSVVIVQDIYRPMWLLLIDGKTIGYVKSADLQEVIVRETKRAVVANG